MFGCSLLFFDFRFTLVVVVMLAVAFCVFVFGFGLLTGMGAPIPKAAAGLDFGKGGWVC